MPEDRAGDPDAAPGDIPRRNKRARGARYHDTPGARGRNAQDADGRPYTALAKNNCTRAFGDGCIRQAHASNPTQNGRDGLAEDLQIWHRTPLLTERLWDRSDQK